ncbi:hypothetical protein [Rhizobium leguminosarum]|nr:hypothetical protein [Rhizobium leguminosarum]
MPSTTDSLTINALGIEASANGQFAIAALLVILAVIALRRRRP